MIYKALRIAMEAHKGQTDKKGKPYIFHPIRVADRYEQEREQIIALLHDVVANSSITFECLERKGIDNEIIEALKYLTPIEGEEYIDFIKRVNKNPIAKQVKIGDLMDNIFQLEALEWDAYIKNNVIIKNIDIKIYRSAIAYLHSSPDVYVTEEGLRITLETKKLHHEKEMKDLIMKKRAGIKEVEEVNPDPFVMFEEEEQPHKEGIIDLIMKNSELNIKEVDEFTVNSFLIKNQSTALEEEMTALIKIYKWNQKN